MQKINLEEGIKKVHFIGIGGISMSGLAEILKESGFTVSGSDAAESYTTKRLQKAGINVAIGNSAENISEDTDLVVYTAAVKKDNPEYQAAAVKGKPLMDRARLLRIIMDAYPYTVCVTGSHGKTTTTSLVAEICLAAGLNPCIAIGGYMGGGYNSRLGDSNSPYFIMEADEYANSFLQWNPYTGVILNIDADHMDFFGDMDNLIASFKQFAGQIKPEGYLVINNAVPGFDRITEGLACNIITFGSHENLGSARFKAVPVQNAPPEGETSSRPADGLGSSFKVMDGERLFAKINLPPSLPGEYNMANALAAAAAASALGISPSYVEKGLNHARGVQRRFQHKGYCKGAEIVDDYAHHPTEIRACLAAAKKGQNKEKGRIICLFQPHTYTRTKNLLKEFSLSFSDAGHVVLLPIFPAREAFDSSISSEMLKDLLIENNIDVVYTKNFDDACGYLKNKLMPGDLLITMGAGDVHMVGERLLMP